MCKFKDQVGTSPYLQIQHLYIVSLIHKKENHTNAGEEEGNMPTLTDDDVACSDGKWPFGMIRECLQRKQKRLVMN